MLNGQPKNQLYSFNLNFLKTQGRKTKTYEFGTPNFSLSMPFPILAMNMTVSQCKASNDFFTFEEIRIAAMIKPEGLITATW